MADENAVLERLQRLEDVMAIQRLQLEYGVHLDARDLHAYSRLFCEDGEWTGATGTAVGPDGIQAMLEANLPGNPAPPGATTWHIMANPIVEVDGDTAKARAIWVLLRRGEGGRPDHLDGAGRLVICRRAPARTSELRTERGTWLTRTRCSSDCSASRT